MAPVVDPPRLLPKRSELGYTDRLDLALSDEPEAVDQATQRDLTQRAKSDARARERAEWEELTAPIRQALVNLRDSHVGRRKASDLRVIARVIERVDHDLR